MHLLQSGVDIATIALWLGHASPATTHHYLEDDLSAKEATLRRLPQPATATRRFRPNDGLLAFLENL
jgi:integrase